MAVTCEEITRLPRGQERTIASSEQFDISQVHDEDMRVTLFIPSRILCGYDPLQYRKLGFSYRLHSFRHGYQNFSCSEREFNIARHPELLATLIIKD